MLTEIAKRRAYNQIAVRYSDASLQEYIPRERVHMLSRGNIYSIRNIWFKGSYKEYKIIGKYILKCDRRRWYYD